MSENFVCSNKGKGCKGTCLRKFTYPEFQDALFRSYDEATLEELGPPTIEMKLKNEHNQYCSTTVTSLEVAKIKNVFNKIASDPAINQTLRETYQQLRLMLNLVIPEPFRNTLEREGHPPVNFFQEKISFVVQPAQPTNHPPALTASFPHIENEQNFKSCFFHHLQAVKRKLFSLHMQEQYNNNLHGLKEFVRKISMIGFLNPAQQPNGGISHVMLMYNLLVTELFNENIVHNVVDFPQIGAFLNYFEDTWMINNVIPWNLFHLNDNDIRTNNQLEGWHNKMNLKFNDKKPTLWKFITQIQQSQLDSEIIKTTAAEGQLGENVFSRRSNNQLRRNAALNAHKQMYVDGLWTPLNYINNVYVAFEIHGMND
eukprot:gene10151-13654_t